MLARHIVSYIPSLVIPAVASFAAIFCFTRLMSTEEYGYYSLVLSTMTLLNAVFFYWLQVSIPRLMPQAEREGKPESLKVTSYISYGFMSFLLVIGSLVLIGFITDEHMRHVAWLAVPMALARGALNMNQAYHRSTLNIKRYNLLECGQAILGLGIGLGLVYFLDMGMTGAILGMIAGMVIMLMLDARMLIALMPSRFDREILAEFVRFGWPLVMSFALGFIISSSNRFLIEYYRDAGEVGIYAAGYSLMDRIATIIFMIVATASFPLTVHKLEHEGEEAARQQTYNNGVALLILALPACAGLVLTTEQLSAVLIGEEFRAGAIQVMPWVAASALFNGMSIHYFDHAFHLAKKPLLLTLTQGPVALFNVAANLILIPKYGYMGAAYTTAASYMLQMAMSVFVGRRVFRIRFPIKPAVQIAGCVALMSLALVSFTFPANLVGLTLMVIVGGGVYGAGLLALNVMNIRSRLSELKGRFRSTAS